MSIDWSKAPEGATHAGIIPSRKTNVWYRDIDPDRGRYKYFSLMDESWNINFGSPIAKELIPRPAESSPAAPTWDGQGLPPVGIEAEIIWDSTDVAYYRAKILAHDEDRVVFRWCEGESKGQYGSYAVLNFGILPTFRPIRTPEQIAAEERSKECDRIFFILSNVKREGNRSDMAEALYDAGYRRQESST